MADATGAGSPDPHLEWERGRVSTVKSEATLRDPLSEVTRKERRTLLGVAALGIVVARAGIVPSRISALGVEFGKTDQLTLLRMLALIIGYFLLAFLTYALSDFMAWRLAVLTALRKSTTEIFQRAPTERSLIDAEGVLLAKELSKNRLLYGLTTPVSILRATVEFLLPLGTGLYALAVLL